MKTIKKQKTSARPEGGFDAVKMMREIRDNISAETQNMSFEELKAYISKQLSDSKTKLIGQSEKVFFLPSLEIAPSFIVAISFSVSSLILSIISGSK